MEITITIEAPDLANAILALADSLSKQGPAQIGKSEAAVGKPQDRPTEEAVPTKPKSGNEPISLEQVRAKLAALTQSGKQAEVKRIITEFGASKLTEIPQEKYPEVLAVAESVS